MRIYRDFDVFEGALRRLRWIFDQFEDRVGVCMSGGKDSTVTLELALMVAKERGALPIKVLFLDQEAEWQSTVDYVRTVMDRPEVEPLWYQIPMQISNATSHETRWLNCWHEGETWMRDREPGAITVNDFGTLTFKDLFDATLKRNFPEGNACYLTGMRAEESPARKIGMMTHPTYKWATWGRAISKPKRLVNLFPIWNWTYKDVWKAIHDNGWPYNRIYDEQYRHGLPVRKMRVSNLHHETAIEALYYLQEAESETWDRLCARLSGVNTTRHLTGEVMKCPKQLPYMFSSWKQYRDYLAEKLPSDDEIRRKFKSTFARMDLKYEGIPPDYGYYAVQITSLIVDDYHLVKIENREIKREVKEWYSTTHGIDNALARAVKEGRGIKLAPNGEPWRRARD